VRRPIAIGGRCLRHVAQPPAPGLPLDDSNGRLSNISPTASPRARDPTRGPGRPQGDRPAPSPAFPVELPNNDFSGSEVTVRRRPATKYDKGDELEHRRCSQEERERARARTTNGTTITPARSLWNRPAAGPRLPQRQKWFPSSAGHTPRSKQAGQIPSELQSGSGAIVSGSAANKRLKLRWPPTREASSDRVVKLSNGEYEVHKHRRQLAAPRLRQPGLQRSSRQLGSGRRDPGSRLCISAAVGGHTDNRPQPLKK